MSPKYSGEATEMHWLDLNESQSVSKCMLSKAGAGKSRCTFFEILLKDNQLAALCILHPIRVETCRKFSYPAISGCFINLVLNHRFPCKSIVVAKCSPTFTLVQSLTYHPVPRWRTLTWVCWVKILNLATAEFCPFGSNFKSLDPIHKLMPLIQRYFMSFCNPSFYS